MKTKIILAILFAFLFSQDIYAKNPPAKSINGVYKFSGKLNGKIPVFLWFVVQDSVLKGEVTYLKTAKRIPITVIGTITKDKGLELFEFGRDSHITGIYNGNFDTNSLTGTWSAPGTEKEFKYILIPKDTVLNHHDIDLSPISITGEYLYRWGKKGCYGSVTLRREKGQEYSMEINCVTSFPESHVAEVERTKVRLLKNTIYYRSSDPDWECSFRVRAFKDFLVIDYPLGKRCQFGLNADVDGVFIKVSDVPKFAF